MQSLTQLDRDNISRFTYDALSQFTEQSDRPTLTVVLGQTGTPREVVQSDLAERQMSAGGAVVVGSSDMERVANGYGLALDERQANNLASDVAALAIEDKRSVVFAPAPTLDDGSLSVIAAARRAGYRVEVAALAVNPQLAAAQTLQRGLADAGRVPATDREHTSEAVGVLKQLRRIEANGVADKIGVYDRAGNAVENSSGELSASDIFSRERERLSGFDKVQLAASFEETAEAYERLGEELSSTAQRLRQQAHYQVRQDPNLAASFDDKHPEHRHTSIELAADYGEELGRLFDAGNTAAVVTHPELTNAFVVQRVTALLAKEQSTPEIAAAGEARIHRALVEAIPIRAPEIREQRSLEIERAAAEVER
ncbi:zeta toxin family protein [Xanthomonas arboricola]|uniref:zeta toxin family protein n=1 Tax=Xanthomonas TaxID=338 RepID=UPI00069EAE9A|nr:zeta toxin family protein [Xanthomonas arboricola]KOB18409.1 hypothetical protein AE925_11555 [Xanthomonas arboricola]